MVEIIVIVHWQKIRVYGTRVTKWIRSPVVVIFGRKSSKMRGSVGLSMAVAAWGLSHAPLDADWLVVQGGKN